MPSFDPGRLRRRGRDLATLVDSADSEPYPRPSRGALREDRRSPASSRPTPEVSLAPVVRGGRRRRSWRNRPRIRQSATMRTCAQLGIKPELRRSLGFLSNFAVAFSYISVSTGTFTVTSHRRSDSAGPIFFWAWPIVIIGQTFVALDFAELASHFPVAGSIYQWSKRLSNRTLGWFTGWLYFWAGVVTDDGGGSDRRHSWSRESTEAQTFLLRRTRLALRRCSPSSRSSRSWSRRRSTRSACGSCRSSTTSASATEILGMLVFALILLFFFNHQIPAILFDSSGLESGGKWQCTSPSSRSACSSRCSSCTGSTPQGHSARRHSTRVGRRHAGSVGRSGCLGIIGAVFLLAIMLVVPGPRCSDRRGPGVRLPHRDDDATNLNQELVGWDHVR